MIIKPGDPNFYINKHRYIEIENHQKLVVGGFFSGRAIKPGVGVIREFGASTPCPNLITDIGMNALGTSPNFSVLHFGTGTSSPQFTDSGLASHGGSIPNSRMTASQGASSAAPYFGWYRMRWTSDVGAAAGVWTELGVGPSSSNSQMRSRALILDSNGNPTSFPVLGDEQFEVTYEFRNYVMADDAPATVTIGSTTYETVSRALRATGTTFGSGWTMPVAGATPFGILNAGSSAPFTGELGLITASSPQGTAAWLQTPTASSAPYSQGSYSRDASLRYGSGSAGTMRTLQLLYTVGAALQVRYDPTITKLTTEELIFNQRISWARR